MCQVLCLELNIHYPFGSNKPVRQLLLYCLHFVHEEAKAFLITIPFINTTLNWLYQQRQVA